VNLRSVVLSLAAAAVAGGCGGGGCNTEPLPGGALPADQTIEGGGQIRVTQQGFQKLTAVVAPAINDLIGDGLCIPQGEWGDPDGTCGLGTYYCNHDMGGACGNTAGCDVGLHLDFVDLSVPDQHHLTIAVQIDLDTVAHLDYQGFCASDSCDMNVVGNNIYLSADIVFDIDPADGELRVHLEQINDYDLSGVQFSNCSFISSAGNFARDFIESWFGQWIVDYLTPTIDDMIQGMLPDPLGIEGIVDLGPMLGGISPGTDAQLEARMVPGGYVQLRGGGMSLGLITGLNSDEDPATRSAALDSEPAFCVPPIPVPNFAAPPAQLPATTRGTFTLTPAEEFLGSPEPADDLVMGISETTLDLAGHHLVTSGGMCLGVGTSVIAQLNLGTFSLLVPSLSTLGDAASPVLLVTRPQRALDFEIGDNDSDSPAISVAIHDLEVDVYVFVYERYVRAFTMRLDLTLGVNLTFDQETGQPATVTPELVGLDADAVEVTVLNEDFVAETREELESVLPTVFDLVVGLLGNGLPAIDVPDFAGFRLGGLRIQHVTTVEDDFVALYATLAQAQKPSIALDPAPVRLVSVDVPSPEAVRETLRTGAGRLPTVTLEVPSDGLEHAWRLHGGPWRPFRTGDTIEIADRAFAWQGVYQIDVRSRVPGDYTAVTAPSSVTVRIDSVAPAIDADAVRLDEAGLTVPARDLVSASAALRYAWARPGDAEPATDYATSPTLDAATLDDLADGGEIAVFVQDEAGNIASARIAFHGQASEGGCGCQGAGTPGSGALALVAIALLSRRRRRRLRPDPAPRT
jgi:MYXO-CTERM domain-containing protein